MDENALSPAGLPAPGKGRARLGRQARRHLEGPAGSPRTAASVSGPGNGRKGNTA